MYEKGSRITYICFGEDEYTTGILNAILDSSVILGKDTIILKHIAGIRKKAPGHKLARIAGMPFMLIGSLFMGEGVAGMYSNPDSNGGIRLFLIGAGIFTIGYIPFQLDMKDLTVGFRGEWTISIVRKK